MVLESGKIAREPSYALALALIAGSMIGFITLLIAHHLSMDGDTMEMMRAVLDTNGWLATHVPGRSRRPARDIAVN